MIVSEAMAKNLGRSSMAANHVSSSNSFLRYDFKIFKTKAEKETRCLLAPATLTISIGCNPT